MNLPCPLHRPAGARELSDPDELATLIADLHATFARLDEITAGEIDSVSDGSGGSFLLRGAQIALRLSEAARNAAILDTLPLHIALIDSTASITSVNAAWTAFADGNAVQCAGLGVGSNYLQICDDAVGPDVGDARAAGAGIRSVLAGTAQEFILEYPCHSPSVQRWFQMTVSPVISATSIGAVIMHLDISVRRLAAQNLLESELRFRQMAENIREVFVLRDLDGSHVLYVSPAFEEIWGRSRESLYADPALWVEAVHPDDRAQTIAAIRSSPHGEFQVEYRVVRPDGSIRWVQSRSYPVRDGGGDLIRVAIVIRDITEKKYSMELLLESQQRLALATASAAIGIWDLDLLSNTLSWDAQMCALYGISELNGAHTAWQNGLHPADRDRVEGEFAQAVSDNRGFHTEFRVVWPNSEIRFIEAHAQVLREVEGVATRIVGVNWDITERKRAERHLRESERRYSELLSNVELFAVMLDMQGRVTFCNDFLLRTTGWRRDEVVARSWFDMFIPADDKDIRPAFAQSLAGAPENWHRENQIRCRTGELRLVKWNNSLLRSADGAVIGTASIGTAIREKRILVANDSQQDPRVLLGPHYVEAGVSSLAVFPLIVADQVVGAFALYASEIDFFQDEEVKLLTELAGNIAFAIDHIDKSLRLDYLAFFDALTGLPSASVFKDRLDQFIQVARQNLGDVCVLVIDLERFTQVNDSLGRAAGDQLLRAVAARLSQFLVEPYTLGRIAADTFAIASPGDQAAAPTLMSDCIQRALEQPFIISASTVTVNVQAGIAWFPGDGNDSDTVFKNAESALKSGKRSGARNTHFSRALNDRVEQRYAAEQELRSAIAAAEFIVHYQPRVDMISGELVGAEALIRWQHPQRGIVAPVEFIALAEETGLIVTIGAWVLETVCAQQSAWVSARVAVVPIAVNLSSIQFEHGSLVETVSMALAAHRLDPRLLVLELTESAVMNDPAAAAIALHALRKIGVGLALDDFGTGYSSLAHLKHFPFDSVKIDRSFITDITSNPEDAAIASAIIAMAHGLKLKVVAEGVETQGQFNYLRARSCDEMQGYLFGPAVPRDEFESQLRSSRRLRMPAADPADQLTLLIVDDEPGIRASLARMLRSDGYRILQADSGQAGLDVLALNEVQVIISDQRMLGMTGTEFLSAVSQLYPNTVRMILSGFTDLKVVTDAVNRGSVFKFLTKPWDDDVLREQVRDAFRRHRAI